VVFRLRVAARSSVERVSEKYLRISEMVEVSVGAGVGQGLTFPRCRGGG
jgi:hypothetical protein